MPGLDHVRSQSLFGSRDVKCYFTWDIDVQGRRGRRSSTASSSSQLPPGAAADALAVERHRRGLPLHASRQGLLARPTLKTAQDWILERQFRQVPGVIDVVGFGGETKEYHVEVDPYRLKGAGRDAQAAASTRARQRQPERRRSAHHARRAVVQRARHRPHRVAARHRRTSSSAETKGVPVRVRDVARRDGRPLAAPRHRRQGRRLRRRAGRRCSCATAASR